MLLYCETGDKLFSFFIGASIFFISAIHKLILFSSSLSGLVMLISQIDVSLLRVFYLGNKLFLWPVPVLCNKHKKEDGHSDAKI